MASPPAGQPLTDSGWFWAGMFSTAALLALVAIAPKFDVRQRQVESRFLGRQQAAIERQRRAAGLPETNLAEEARDRSEVAPGRIVPLWTLMLLAGTATGGSWLMLARDRRRGGGHE